MSITGMAMSSVADILRVNPKPQYWSTAEVRLWLEAIGLEIYVPTFEAAGIQGADLIAMDADALKRRLGVASLGHRSQLVQHIAVLSARANQSFKREDSAKSTVAKRRELLESMYPDRALRQQRALQEEKVLEARAKYWNPDDRIALLDKQESSLQQVEVAKRPQPKPRPTTSTQRPSEPLAPVGGENLVPRFTTNNNVRRPQTASRPAAQRAPTHSHAHAQKTEEVTDESQETEMEDAIEAPSKKMVRLTDEIKKLEAEAQYQELIRAWAEYGACVRIEYSDTHPLLVRTHFSMATTYLRQKMVLQALQHFKAAEEINGCPEAAAHSDAHSFTCRIWEGMGICETRLGHFSSAHTLLDKAKRACRKKRAADGEAGGGGEEEEELDTAAASVLVALSELYSAEGVYEHAVDCLERAWELKEEELGSDHPQIGKLFSAMAAVKQKLLRQKLELLADAQATLQSALRVKVQIDDQTEGLVLKGGQEEQGIRRLVKDIGQMQDKTATLEKEARYLKGEVLDLIHRAYKVADKNWGAGHGETAKLWGMCQSLAQRYRQEEHQALAASSPTKTSPTARAADDAVAAFMKGKGVDLSEWGLDGGTGAGGGDGATQGAGIDRIVSSLKRL